MALSRWKKPADASADTPREEQKKKAPQVRVSEDLKCAFGERAAIREHEAGQVRILAEMNALLDVLHELEFSLGARRCVTSIVEIFNLIGKELADGSERA